MLWKLTVATGILGAATTLAAQAPGQQAPADRPANPPTTEQRSPQSSDTKENKITVAGCLKPGASAGSFILADAGMAAPANRETPPVAQGTAGSVAKSYSIVAKPGEDLAKHVNHKIEVTGTVSASRPASAPPPETPSSGAPQPAATFNVESFKMVAMTCP